MKKLLDSFNEHILKIYNDNFPPYLRKSNKQFTKDILNYKFFDLWIDHIDNSKQHFNNLNLIEGLNKQTTYLHPTFSSHNNPLKGFAFLNYFPKLKLIHLDYISLDKKYQGNGNGTKYLKHIINTFYTQNKKIKYLILECEDHLVKFYEKNDFHKLNIKYNYFGMRLNLMIYNFKNCETHEIFKCSYFLSNYFSIKNPYTPIIIICHNHLCLIYLFLIIETQKYHIFDNFKKKYIS